MYLKLCDLLYYFEDAFENKATFLSIVDYQIYSEEEKLILVNKEIYQREDFLLIPKKDFQEIVVKYLIKKNNSKLLREKESKDFYKKFHWYIEDNLLVEEWKYFEKTELIYFASAWCEQNQIKFTVK